MAVQMYPRVYNTACQAVNVLQKLSKAGGVDISDLSQRIAAGSCPTTTMLQPAIAPLCRTLGMQ